MSNVSIEEFPVEINEIITEYVAGMLLAEKVSFELKAIIEEPATNITDIHHFLDLDENGVGDHDDYLTIYAYDQIFIWWQFVARILGCTVFTFLDVWTRQHTDGDINNGPISTEFWVTGISRIDQRVARDCMYDLFEEKICEIFVLMLDNIDMGEAKQSFKDHILGRPSWGTNLKNLGEEFNLFLEENFDMGSVLLYFIDLVDEIRVASADDRSDTVSITSSD